MKQIDYVAKRWYVALIFGIVALGLGIFMLFNPVTTYVALSYAFAIYFIAYGVYKAVMTYKEREVTPAWGWSFALGIITAILGVLLLFPGMATGTFVYYVGFSVLFMGINTIAVSFGLKEMGDKGWGWTLAFGILTIVLSVAMLISPFFSMNFISIFSGLMFIMLGIELCILAYRLNVIKDGNKKINAYQG